MRAKEPNHVEALGVCGVGKVPSGARRFLKKVRAKLFRRYAKADYDNTRPKAKHRGWYW